MQIDSLNVLSSIQAFPDQASQVLSDLSAFRCPAGFDTVSSIVVSGMGGSALGGRIIASLERQIIKVPIVISTEYHLPNFVNENTLVIASSYSGNTEETLASLDEAKARNAKILIVAAGGKLEEIAKTQNYPAYIFKPRFNPCGQPRLALVYNIAGLLKILTTCGLIHDTSALNQLPEFLKSQQSQASTYEQIATNLIEKLPVVVCSEHLKGAGIAFRNQINENAKTFSAFFDLPELNHHLMEGLTSPKSNPQNLCFLMVESDKYHPRIKRRYELTKQLLKKREISFTVLKVSGESGVFEAFDLVQAGAYVAYYLSQAQSTDPGPVPWVDWFKDELVKN